MPKFIAFTGTHSTGKSTFVDDLTDIAEKQGLRVGKVKDNASECAKAGFPILRDHTFSSTLWIMTTVIREEQHESLSADLVIVDRPVSDAIGYLEAALAVTGRNVPPRIWTICMPWPSFTPPGTICCSRQSSMRAYRLVRIGTLTWLIERLWIPT